MNIEWFREHKPYLTSIAKTLLYGAVSYINLIIKSVLLKRF